MLLVEADEVAIVVAVGGNDDVLVGRVVAVTTDVVGTEVEVLISQGEKPSLEEYPDSHGVRNSMLLAAPVATGSGHIF